MMTRPCVLALLGVALLCGFVAGQDQGTATPAAPDAPKTPKKPDATTAVPSSEPEPSAADSQDDQDPKSEAEPESEPEGDDTKAQSEASSSENGAALVSVSLPSLVLAAVLAKVFAH